MSKDTVFNICGSSLKVAELLSLVHRPLGQLMRIAIPIGKHLHRLKNVYNLKKHN